MPRMQRNFILSQFLLIAFTILADRGSSMIGENTSVGLALLFAGLVLSLIHI